MIELVTILLAAAACGDPGTTPAATTIKVPAALVKLIEQVDVPSQEAGVLSEVLVQEGQEVTQGQMLAKVRDVEARLAQERAKTEMEIARRRAENDINIRYAKKAVDVARAELKRAIESNEKYPGSISNTEMDRLRLVVEKSTLEVEQADHEFAIAQQTLDIKVNEHQLAQQDVQRRQITAPLNGVVVQVNRRKGEWVEPGDMVFRVLLIDRLRAEGFVNVRDLRHNLKDNLVTLLVDLPGQDGVKFPGRLIFIDPEIDPVNAQVRVWAEVDNVDRKLWPGMRADLVVEITGDRETRGN